MWLREKLNILVLQEIEKVTETLDVERQVSFLYIICWIYRRKELVSTRGCCTNKDVQKQPRGGEDSRSHARLGLGGALI